MGDVTSHDDAVFNIGTADNPGGIAGTYTNVPNYSARSGGNNKTNGTFVGAVTTQPLRGQPPFDSPSTRVATRSTRMSAAVIHVTDSSQLSSLLDNAAPGPNGKVGVSPVTRSRNPSVQGSTRTMHGSCYCASSLCGCKSKIRRPGISHTIEREYSGRDEQTRSRWQSGDTLPRSS